MPNSAASIPNSLFVDILATIGFESYWKTASLLEEAKSPSMSSVLPTAVDVSAVLSGKYCWFPNIGPVANVGCTLPNNLTLLRYCF